MDNKFNYFTTSNKVYMVIIAVLIVVIFGYGHYIIGLTAIALYALLVVYNVRNSKVKKDEWKKFIENFSSKLDIATRNTLVKLPFPLIIIGNTGNILWYNQNSNSMLEGEDILGINIADIIKDLNMKQLLEEQKNYFENVNVKGKFYNIYTTVVDTVDNIGGKDNIILLYFSDVTDIVDLKKTLEETRETVMLVEVDNLDEVIKSTEEDKKPLLVAEVERTINGYAQNINAMLKKYSTNKYVLSIQDKYIQKEMEKKFDILDIIREINTGNKLAVTLSVGVGRNGDTPLDNYNLALSAKELALGRGGDQVIVKSGEKLSFYGGKTKEVEKRTKVRARVIAHALVDLIQGSSKVFIMGHKTPDIDCFGAAVGVSSAVKMLKKDCYVILEGANTSINQIVEKFENDKDYEGVFVSSDFCRENLDEDSLLVLVDVHSRGYVHNADLVKEFKNLVIIDHHRKSTDFIEGAILTYMEPYASSTSEMVTEMMPYMIENPKIKPIEAEALLAGICVDTKNFYFKTGVRTFEAAGFLRKHGADTIDIKKMFANNLDSYVKRAEIMKSAKVENNIAIAICPPGLEDTVIAAQAADELLNITGIQASFVLVKIEEEILISGRSLGDVNVQLILESLGGGGHMTIAGARLKDVSLEEAVNMLRNAIDENLKESEKK